MKRIVILAMAIFLAGTSHASFGNHDVVENEAKEEKRAAGWYCIDMGGGFIPVLNADSACPFGVSPFYVSLDQDSYREASFDEESFEEESTVSY